MELLTALSLVPILQSVTAAAAAAELAGGARKTNSKAPA